MPLKVSNNNQGAMKVMSEQSMTTAQRRRASHSCGSCDERIAARSLASACSTRARSPAWRSQARVPPPPAHVRQQQQQRRRRHACMAQGTAGHKHNTCMPGALHTPAYTCMPGSMHTTAARCRPQVVRWDCRASPLDPNLQAQGTKRPMLRSSVPCGTAQKWSVPHNGQHSRPHGSQHLGVPGG